MRSNRSDSYQTLTSLVRHRAETHPNHRLYTWLANGESADKFLTVAELDRRARAIAVHLREVVGRGERALLLYHPGLDFIAAFIGCAYASVIAAPGYAVRNARQMRRMEFIASDSEPAVVLTTRDYLQSGRKLAAESALKRPLWIATNDLDENAAEEWREDAVAAADILYLQYTSGSTADPKGVMVTDANLLENLAYIDSNGGFEADTTSVSWLPHFHDMGLVYGWLQPIFSCFCSYQMAPAAFMQRPVRWLRAISRYRGTHCGGPNFAFQLCADRVAPEQIDALDLSSWRVAFTGAEPIHSSTLERFAQSFGVCGFKRSAFYPVYGLAEATLKVTSVKPGSGPMICRVDGEALQHNQLRYVGESTQAAQELVGCGEADGSHKVVIADPVSGRVSEPGSIGEIWVSGPSVALGYWNRPVETERKFRATLAEGETEYYLRTGDLGAFHQGQLIVAGRVSDVIIIRGRNYHPQDIEATVADATEGIRTGGVVAFGITRNEQERLVIVAEATGKDADDYPRIATAIRRSVSEECELQVYVVELVSPGSLELTSSGKLKRSACRASFLDGALDAVYRQVWDPIASSEFRQEVSRQELINLAPEERQARIETSLIRALSRMLRIEEHSITPGDSPISLGADSLVATELAHKVEEAFDISIGAAEILADRDIRAFAAAIGDKLSTGRALPTLPVGGGEGEETEFPLSYGQSALWFLQKMKPQSTAWNITRGLKIHGRLDELRLRAAIQGAVGRHAALRASFSGSGGVPFQRIHRTLDKWIECADLEEATPEELGAALEKFAFEPFRLSDWPLIRVALWRRSADETIFLISVHHLISDLWSLDLLWRDIAEFYIHPERSAAPPAYSYRDFVLWQQEWVLSPEMDACLSYWQKTLAEPLPHTALTRSSAGRATEERKREKNTLHVKAVDVDAAKHLADMCGTTPYVVFLAAFLALLRLQTGETDLLIGTPVHGRGRKAFRDVVGLFVNTVPIRADLSGDPGFREVVGRVSKIVAGALEHSALPFPLLVERLRNRRDASLTPLVQTMFVFYGASMLNGASGEIAVADAGASCSLGDLPAIVLDVHEPMTQFDLTLTMAEVSGGGATACFEYDSSRLNEVAMRDVAGHFDALLRNALETPDAPVSDLPVLTASEVTRIVRDWNDTAKARTYISLWDLIESQVKMSPDSIAVSFADGHLSYGALNERALRLASRLREQCGIGPESISAVCCNRSLELIITLLGVGKAGSAYLPLDPEHPAERLEYMLSQSGASVLLCQAEYVSRFPKFPNVVVLEESLENGGLPATDMGQSVEPENLAYVIFTSGSTGRPKGVMIGQDAICNRLLWMKEQYGITQDDVLLHKTPVTFDVSLWELFLPLISGARMVVARPGKHRDPAYLAHISGREQVTTIHFIPRMLRATLDTLEWTSCRALRNVICSGEILPQDVQEAFFAKSGAALHNLYGPTEATVDVSAWECVKNDWHTTVPIGRPISNTRLHILDRNMKPVPVGCPGELYIGDVALSRGYIGCPDLTAASFVPNPLATSPGARLYRTGDLSRYDDDGNIEFLGRMDTQVKVRGLRVETEEIEEILRRQADVRECAVVLDAAREELVAYVSLEPGSRQSGRHLRSALGNALPDYMLPARFIQVPLLPLSASGKLDRAALPNLSGASILRLQESSGSPESFTATEARLMQIWSNLLSEDIRSVDDNFFTLGGHSLLAMRMADEIRRVFEVELPLESTFGNEGTIASIAAVIDELAKSCASPE